MPRRSAKNLISDARETLKEAKVAALDEQLRTFKAKYRNALAEARDLQKQNDILLEIAHANGQKRRYRKPAKGKKTGVAAVAVCSDWHVEEKVDPRLVSYKNEYNLDIAWARIERLFQKIVLLIDVQNSIAPVQELWLAILGDMLSGYIHDELMEDNELSPVETILWLREAITAGIDYLLTETKLPIYIPTCHGNHGRTTVRKRIQTSYKNSYEWLMYHFLAAQYEENPRVHWLVGEGYHNTQRIMGRLTRFHHGDGLRYQGGVGGLTIPTNKAIAQWNKVRTVDFDFFGHWHTYLWNYPTWVSNGSLIGYSPFAVEIKADFQHPTQTFAVIDNRYGMTQSLPIFVERAKG